MGKVENEDNRMFRLVYEATARILRELCEPFRDALLRLNADRDGYEFGQRFTALVEEVLFAPLDQPPLSAMTVHGADPRKTFLRQTFLGIGVRKGHADNFTDSLLTSRKQYDESGKLQKPDPRPFVRPIRSYLATWRPILWAAASTTLRQVEAILRLASEGYKGTPDQPKPGIEQTVEMLRRFPDLADRVYSMVGFKGLRGFPPTGPCDPAEARFQRITTDVLKKREDDEFLETVGLIVLSIALTALSFGALGPMAAMLVGAGLGVGHGGVLVVKASARVAEGRVATSVGAMTEDTLKYLENELGAAWAAVLIDAVTLGTTGRLGGGKVVWATLKAVGFSAAGGGLSVAANKNVWADEDRLGLILKGALWSAVGAGAGVAIGSVAIKISHRITMALDRTGGHLAPGRAVRWSTDDSPVQEGTVVKVENADVTVKSSDGKQFVVRIDQIFELRASATPPAKTLQRGVEGRPTIAKSELDIPASLAPVLQSKPYGRMPQLAEYMKRRGVEVRWGKRGGEALDVLANPETLGMFLVGKAKTPSGQVTRTALVFRDEPSSLVVHHELWHRQDFIKNHGADYKRWEAARSIDQERYVDKRLTESRRWNDYGSKDKANQKAYIEKLETKEKLNKMRAELRALGIDLD